MKTPILYIQSIQKNLDIKLSKAEIKKLDTKGALIIKEDEGFRCEISGLQKGQCQLNSHHFIGRRYRSLRWWLPNGVCLSSSSHTLSCWSAHENANWFRSEMLDRRGKKWLDDLVKRSNVIFKGTYQEVLDYLEGKREDYL